MPDRCDGCLASHYREVYHWRTAPLARSGLLTMFATCLHHVVSFACPRLCEHVCNPAKCSVDLLQSLESQIDCEQAGSGGYETMFA